VGKSAGSTPHWFFAGPELIGCVELAGYRKTYDQLISDYGPHLARLNRPERECTLTPMLFARA
jgi:hypothetical protein